MSYRFKIVTFINFNNENRFKVIGCNGNTFLDCNGYGYKTSYSAFRYLCFFNSSRNKNKTI